MYPRDIQKYSQSESGIKFSRRTSILSGSTHLNERMKRLTTVPPSQRASANFSELGERRSKYLPSGVRVCNGGSDSDPHASVGYTGFLDAWSEGLEFVA